MIRRHKGSLSIEAALAFPFILLSMFLITKLIAFNLESSSLLYITAQTSRYASLASTTSNKEIIEYVEQQFAQQNTSTTDMTIDIDAPYGISTPGGAITITISLPFNNLVYSIFPDKISKSFVVIKEG